MKIGIIGIIVLLTFGACKSDAQDKNSSMSIAPFGDVTATQARAMKAENNDIIFLDVRTPGETRSGMIEGAIEVDYREDDFKIKIDALDKDKEYIVYCRSGVRSKDAQGYMKQSGFKTAKNMLGGYESWAK
jgi:rhodanese-related sulfurtransferase